MLYEIRKELGFSRHEWWELDWIDRRMYTEEMAIIKWEEAMDNWKQSPAGKRGSPPKKPVFSRFTDNLEPTPEELRESNNGLDPDIGTLEGMDITDAS